MYEKFLVVASKLDKAGINITTQLSQFPGSSEQFKFYLVDKEIIYTESFDPEKINDFDFVIFASKHASESGEKTLSIHAPGNWRSADYGGERGKVCKSSSLFFKHIFTKLNENVEHYDLKNYKVTMETTHHGPLINKPCVFVEIGSTETEWSDRRAAFILAKTISDSIESFKENPYNEVAVAVGGPHYCPNFNKVQGKSNVAISHVISQNAFPLTEEMVREAIEKTEEEVDMILLDWKGLGRKEHKDEVLKILDKFFIPKKRTGEVDK
ncbi:MAG: D-aminoacyl-tRNA deacylase [Nanoarchaeota archaeon]|nr:D-aminoacyl-tRNA deacylase [Nanoarchaeota archaeon]MBU1501545.1 D-aminoacyl-tRNA deacylase [Nanoarchaeota archaeon]MBU2459152.1 D-aminoacyl-tRNA deacylase [Nanoarchaeota archaeon]